MIGTDIRIAAERLNAGETVGIPTETVYGLAANALNEDAVVSIFRIKNRPFFDPLILHVRDIAQAETLIKNFPEKARLLAEAFWPGPLTLLLPKNDIVPDIITSGSELVALRVPSHPMTLDLLRQFDFPLAAPSANPFGYISPTQAEHVELQLGDQISYILDGGHCSIGLESTIINCSGEPYRIARLGGLSMDRIEAVLGEKLELQLHQNSNPSAPGQLDKHYSPISSFVLTDDLITCVNQHLHQKIVVLSFGENPLSDSIYQLNLSKDRDMNEAARNLFHYMRLLDQLEADIIIAESLPSYGLGLAINDRLRRAACQNQQL
jgi:L-threonylcarbamoyladenylate synthase